MAGFKNEGSSSASKICIPQTFSDFEISSETADTEYPINTKPLENQVAGHSFKDGKRTVGMLKHSDGYLLKPVNRPVQGEKEIKFYEEMQKVTDPIRLEFKKFIPDYYGTTELELQGKKIKFLLLKDITNGFEEPCIMDIKVGKQTWEPGASVEKQQSEEKKYIECKKSLQFCIPGFQVYDIKTKVYKKYGKEHGKLLNIDGVYDSFKIFFNVEHGVSEQIMVPILLQLKAILDWWKKQNIFHIYSSSILLAYDASFVRKKIYKRTNDKSVNFSDHCLPPLDNKLSSKCLIAAVASWLRVSLIDLAHVVQAENGTPDYNYINGLESLINVFENILRETR